MRLAIQATTVLIGAVMLASACTEQPSPQVVGIKVGNIAPPYTLSDADGQTITNEHAKGKVVLLDISAVW